MNKYTIYCTPEQTKKALELGAPIRNFITKEESKRLVDMAKSENRIDEYENELLKYHQTIIDDMVYCIPTAEQMLGFLEEQGLIISILYGYEVSNKWAVDIDSEEYIDYKSGEFNSRKEASLAAIRAALEYLTNNKK